MHVDPLQVRPTNGEPREVQAAQVAAQVLEQAEDVGGPIALGGRVLGAELREQAQQVDLDQRVCPQFGAQTFEEGMDQQAHLRLSHIDFGLCLLKGHLAQLLRVAQHDLRGQAFAEHIGEVLHHHRLQAKAGLLPSFQQRAPRERFQRLEQLRAPDLGMQDLCQSGKLRPLAQHGQPREQQGLQRRQTPHLLAQHRPDPIEGQFPFLEEAIEIFAEEVGDRLPHDLEGQRIARVAGDEALPGSRRADQSLVGEQLSHGLFVQPYQAQRAHRPACPFQRFDLPGLLAGGQQHTALVGRLAQALDQPPVALVTGQVGALGVTAHQQHLQVVEHQQAAARLQAGHELVDALLQRGGEGSRWCLGEEGDAVGDQLLA
ncbi:MAG: hypothetical protein E6J22_20270, partial [Chloroflexi bacterium]